MLKLEPCPHFHCCPLLTHEDGKMCHYWWQLLLPCFLKSTTEENIVLPRQWGKQEPTREREHVCPKLCGFNVFFSSLFENYVRMPRCCTPGYLLFLCLLLTGFPGQSTASRVIFTWLELRTTVHHSWLRKMRIWTSWTTTCLRYQEAFSKKKCFDFQSFDCGNI